ncbi:MAG: YbaK/EbsC family protein [Mojavia pulchra JT2-VF2]|jgi:Cys-tRNA(Pro)/Cys-tRNA(Cys) deacylase|uniref:YbaK/EbsC family protein n=1 Tax=Mojavia pulchra JT2-VF2 TaxID=287848 RepID=A0A951Q7K5_9NOST|nr:YbaK/EbsC family protein [Mojavia pulchra JT2-VF2]
MVYDKIIKLLTENGIDFKIHTHEVIKTITDVEEKLPFPKNRLLKTVVFKIRNSSWILAAVKGEDRVDYRKLASSLEVHRSDLICPSPEEIKSILDFEIGGVSPIPTSDDTKAVFDSALLSMNFVYCGSGRNDRTLEIGVEELLQLSKAKVISIV